MSYDDARLELWEELCTCGGARNSPDVRMCHCLAFTEAGLDCKGCGRGRLLIKQGRDNHPFWGCSLYQKKGCRFTKPYGHPYDKLAAMRLVNLRDINLEREKREREEEAAIADPRELQWRSDCRCEGAKNLNTFECYLKSEGGCGSLPPCPQCGEVLFLRNGCRGKYWKCHSSACDFSTSYIPHKESSKKKARTAATREPGDERDSSMEELPEDIKDMNQAREKASFSSPSTPQRRVTPGPSSKEIVPTPEQKARMQANRQMAFAIRQRRLEQESGTTAAASPTAAPPFSPPAVASPVAVKKPSSLKCQNAQNESLYQSFCELTALYKKEGNYNAQATYYRVSEAIRTLDFAVTADNAKGLGQPGTTKVAHIGKTSADKIHEFVTTGKIGKLEEKKAAALERETKKS